MDGKRWSGEVHWITTYQGCISFTSAFLPWNPVSKWLCWNSGFSTSKQNKSRRTLGRFNQLLSTWKFSPRSFFFEYTNRTVLQKSSEFLPGSFSMNRSEVLCKVDGAREGLEGRHGKFWKGLEMEGDMKWWRVISNIYSNMIYNLKYETTIKHLLIYRIYDLFFENPVHFREFLITSRRCYSKASRLKQHKETGSPDHGRRELWFQMTRIFAFSFYI